MSNLLPLDARNNCRKRKSEGTLLTNVEKKLTQFFATRCSGTYKQRSQTMLAIILAPIWFGYRANRAGRNPLGWAALGLVAFIVLKGIAFAVTSNVRPHTQGEATTLTILLNVFLFGGLFLLGFFIPAVKKETSVAQPAPSSMFSSATSASADWECPQCHSINRSDTAKCLQCAAERKAG